MCGSNLMASAIARVCDSAPGDPNQEKVFLRLPFKGEKRVPQRATCGVNHFWTLPLSLPACRGGHQGRAQGLLKPRHSPPTRLDYSGVQRHVIMDVPMSSHMPGE